MNMKKFLFLGLFTVALLSAFVFAQTEDEAAKEKAVPTSYGGVSNLTYGSCVSAAAVVKNSCFSEVKDTKVSCKAAAQNATEPRAAAKQCRKDYFASKKECKVEFKATKKECKKLNRKVKE